MTIKKEGEEPTLEDLIFDNPLENLKPLMDEDDEEVVPDEPAGEPVADAPPAAPDQSWREYVPPATDEQHGGLRGKPLAEWDRKVREADISVREANTERNRQAQEASGLRIANQILQDRLNQAANPKAAPVDPLDAIADDELVEDPRAYARHIREVTLAQVRKEQEEQRQRDTEAASAAKVSENIKDTVLEAATQAFQELGVPPESWNPMFSIALAEFTNEKGRFHNPDVPTKDSFKRVLSEGRYFTKPVTPPAPPAPGVGDIPNPPGSTTPAKPTSPNSKKVITIAAEERARYEAIGRAMDMEGAELETYIQQAAADYASSRRRK